MKTEITCPKCSHHFHIEDVLTNDLQKKIREDLQKEYVSKIDEYKKLKDELELQKENEEAIFNQKLDEALAEKQKETDRITEEKYASTIAKLNAELKQKSSENKELLQKEVKLLELEGTLEEREQQLELKTKKLLLEGKEKFEKEGRRKAQEEFELKEIQFNKDMAEQKKLIDDLKRKAEQGSMQKQGEILEIALEEFLQNNFRHDRISEVAKGVNGADVIQEVHNDFLQKCGSIVFETKRTKNFDKKWLDKLKQDQLQCKAEIAVLVTETLPKDIDKFDFQDGVWICSFQEVKTLVIALRQILVQSQSVKVANENRGEKMEILYNYFTSGEFTQKTKRLLDIFDNMSQQLESEKNVTKKLWAKREKEILTMKENLSIVSGDIAGIAGKEVTLLEEFEDLVLE
ncbi:Uncharacterized protein conserved in bacteria [Chryseobacterium taklimakanense]|uniref:Uncharacterized protein conserved in bacteria n=1 Tax=Chryseobacterium taklimakanense TaxID=536441 RepID=A0A239X4R6_9FLAO|nr:DUF2130 domain-containing protein [Chryseobacterium taklimakanense]SNV41642.1 Uncharacterized protein conserved in bacteria [Chryseobacterium taklimakanense]